MKPNISPRVSKAAGLENKIRPWPQLRSFVCLRKSKQFMDKKEDESEKDPKDKKPKGGKNKNQNKNKK